MAPDWNGQATGAGCRKYLAAVSFMEGTELFILQGLNPISVVLGIGSF
jgi:hypothetical protein